MRKRPGRESGVLNLLSPLVFRFSHPTCQDRSSQTPRVPSPRRVLERRSDHDPSQVLYHREHERYAPQSATNRQNRILIPHQNHSTRSKEQSQPHTQDRSFTSMTKQKDKYDTSLIRIVPNRREGQTENYMHKVQAWILQQGITMVCMQQGGRGRGT